MVVVMFVAITTGVDVVVRTVIMVMFVTVGFAEIKCNGKAQCPASGPLAN